MNLAKTLDTIKILEAAAIPVKQDTPEKKVAGKKIPPEDVLRR